MTRAAFHEISGVLISPAEAARHLCISEKHLRSLTNAGHIKYVNIGMGGERERRRYDPADIEGFKTIRSGGPLEPTPKPIILDGDWPCSPVFPRRPAPARDAGHVYFIASAGLVKIGRAKSIKARMNALQSGSPYPIHLIHFEQGGQREEARLHRRFAAHRDRLEWFRIEGALAEFLAEVTR